MRKLCEDNSPTQGLLLGRLNTTEKLIATFKQSTESLQDVTKRDEPVAEEHSKLPEPEIPSHTPARDQETEVTKGRKSGARPERILLYRSQSHTSGRALQRKEAWQREADNRSEGEGPAQAEG